MRLSFEWDPEKSDSNLKKHGVSFEEAGSVLSDPFEITLFDPDHSDEEDRYISLGMSYRDRILVVSYTEREDKIRIISARVANKRERKKYEEETG
jgi:uncharacterized DUF497 family protein